MTCRSFISSLLALSFSLALLPGCGRGKGSATPQAAQELAELRAEHELSFNGDTDADMQAEIAALLSRFEQTADVTLASSPHRITLLHLACVYKKPELARCLLLDGADPNARQLAELPAAVLEMGAAPTLVPADTPLSWAAIPHREDARPEDMLPLINLLVEHGADVNQPGLLNASPLVAAALVPTPAGEAVFLRLLELGARCSEFTTPESEGKPLPLSALLAENGWQTALRQLLDQGATLATPTRSALHAAAELTAADKTAALACAQLLLERGAKVDALNDEGATPLYLAAHLLTEAEEGREPADTEAVCSLLTLLLKNGANPLLCSDADPEFPGSCAADFIAMNPAVQEKLAAQGVSVPQRPINLEAEGAHLLAEICRASLFGGTAEEIAPHSARLASLLATPEPTLQQSPLYAAALGHAVKLLCRVDAAHAAELVAQLPLWREEKAWKSADARCSALMEALLSTPELILPHAALLEHARRMDAWGVTEVAALLTELLERDESAEATVEALCADASPAIRAGALTARLLRADLPAPRNGAVVDWMLAHGISHESAPASLKRALQLTSLDAFWYGNMSAEEVRSLLDAMRAIGAPRAAAFYAELAPNLGNPEELERLTAPGGAADAARYELECATALFIWSQRQEWQALRQAVPAEEP